jgi:hypothetical protein
MTMEEKRETVGYNTKIQLEKDEIRNETVNDCDNGDSQKISVFFSSSFNY